MAKQLIIETNALVLVDSNRCQFNQKHCLELLVSGRGTGSFLSQPRRSFLLCQSGLFRWNWMDIKANGVRVADDRLAYDQTDVRAGRLDFVSDAAELRLLADLYFSVGLESPLQFLYMSHYAQYQRKRLSLFRWRMGLGSRSPYRYWYRGDNRYKHGIYRLAGTGENPQIEAEILSSQRPLKLVTYPYKVMTEYETRLLPLVQLLQSSQLQLLFTVALEQD